MLAEIVWNQNTLAVVCVFAVPIVAIVAGVWAKVEARKSDNDLKRSMVERGMSADEIERILAAKASKDHKKGTG
jgi:ABC-type bacteriocin/lantibiotic exporter with double-glycine peptidase domain